jgi:predicted AAA+ superfamily ATPase
MPIVETTNGQALVKLPNVHPCRRRIIVTFDEEDTITDKHGTIEVIPCWKWFMEIDR